MTNISDFLDAASTSCPESQAVAWNGQTFTFQELAEASSTFQNTLIEEGERVAIALSVQPAWQAILSAVCRGGGEAILLSSRLPLTRVAATAAQEGATTLVVDSDQVDEAAQVWAGALIGVSALNFSRRPPREGSPTAASAPAEAALVLFTSGTTGLPKPVRIPARVIAGAIERMISHLTAQRRQPSADPVPVALAPYIIAFPPYHVSGLFLFLLAVARRAPAVLLAKFSVDAFLDALEQWPVNQALLNPTMIDAVVGSDDPRTDVLMKQIRFVRSGTAPLTPELRERFIARFGIPILQGYGSTETGGEVAGWTAQDSRTFGATKSNSVGRGSPGVRIEIRDERENVLPAGNAGRILVHVPWLRDDFHDMGDLGYLDEDGFLFVLGRSDDTINCGGFMIHPTSVEEAVKQTPGVIDCGVVGEPDARLGQVPVAYVVIDEAAPPSDHQILGTARTALAPYECPRRIHRVAALPRNELGKLQRHQLRSGR